MDNLWKIFTSAPWWVYLLLIYLVRLGILSFRPRTITIQRVVLFPCFFIAMSVYDLYIKVAMGFPSLVFYWIVCLVLGAYLGVKEVYSWHFHKDQTKGLITIPGNYSTLILVLLVFVLKFIWGTIYATHMEVSYGIYLADTMTSAVVTGIFVGRAGFFFKKYYSKNSL